MRSTQLCIVVVSFINVAFGIGGIASGQPSESALDSEPKPRYESPPLIIENTGAPPAAVAAMERFNKQVAEIDQDFGKRLEPYRKKAFSELRSELQKAGGDADATAIIENALSTIAERAEFPLAILARNKAVSGTARSAIDTYYSLLQHHDQSYRDALSAAESKLIKSLEVEVTKARRMANAASLNAIAAAYDQLRTVKRKPLIPARFDRRRYSSGMVILDYPQDLDTIVNEDGVLLDHQLGKPLIVKAQPHKGTWNVTSGRCAVARFYLKIDAPGDYFFKVYGHYTGKAILAVGDTLIEQSKTDNGSVETQVTLQPGMIPIVSVGRVGNKKVDIRWRPATSKTTTFLPAGVVFYDRRELQEFRRTAR